LAASARLDIALRGGALRANAKDRYERPATERGGDSLQRSTPRGAARDDARNAIKTLIVHQNLPLTSQLEQVVHDETQVLAASFSGESLRYIGRPGIP
jgi:hypothetical protein